MSKIGVFMLYCTPNRHLKVCRKILWFPCFPCFSWPRKLEKTNENKKNKKARKCHTLRAIQNNYKMLLPSTTSTENNCPGPISGPIMHTPGNLKKGVWNIGQKFGFNQPTS